MLSLGVDRSQLGREIADDDIQLMVDGWERVSGWEDICAEYIDGLMLVKQIFGAVCKWVYLALNKYFWNSFAEEAVDGGVVDDFRLLSRSVEQSPQIVDFFDLGIVNDLEFVAPKLLLD